MKPYDEKKDPLFYIDAMMGKIMNVLAIIGLFCAFVAGCFALGYLI